MSYIPRSSRFRKRKKINLKKIGTLVTLVIFIVMVFASIRFFVLFNTLRGSDSPAIWRPESEDRVQFLLVGKLDNVITCSLLSVPSGKDQTVYILRLPPQSLLGDEQETKTLTELFAQDGIQDTVSGIDHLLANQLPIHHYVVYDVQRIAEIVNVVEDVEVDLPAGFDVHYGDTDYIFAPGINSITIDTLVPFIAADSSLEAVSFWAEKSLLVELFNQLFSLNHISYLVTNLKAVSNSYETDMSARELAKFRDTLQALAWEETNFLTLPGRWVSAGEERYWSTERGLAGLTARQIIENMPPYHRGELVVDVYNGNGVNGFAATTASRLQEQDFQIGRVANAQEADTTQIYYLPEFKLAALELAMYLDVEAVLIEERYTNSDNPVAVILGRDLIGGNE